MIELQGAAWLAHRYDETSDSFRFVHLPREARKGVTFLTDEYLPSGLIPTVITRERIGDASIETAPLHFIFHSGFCCSTLLTQALNLPGIATDLSEPTILGDIVGYGQRGANTEKLAKILDQTLELLARPFEPGEAVVVKPSCTVNVYDQQILAMRPDSKALFLYAPIRVFLNSIARKGLTGRLWARELFLGLRRTKKTELGFTEDELFGQTDLQIAGLAWLTQNIYFETLLAEFGEERVRSIDSETFISFPAETLEQLGRLFALKMKPEQAAAIAASDVFHRHSKFGDEFDADKRKQERAVGENAHADEIEKVAIWVEMVAEGLGAAMQPAGRLIG